jgi:heme A synthase
MTNSWLYRLAILLAGGALLLIVNGTLRTEASVHGLAAMGLSLLTLGFVAWLILSDPRPASRRLGWVTLAITALAAMAGLSSVQSMAPHLAGILHACLAPLFFTALVATAMTTSPAWFCGPEFVSDYGWPSMRSLAIMTPLLVLLQIALGAAFRQKALTLLPHVLGAMFVALVILLESIFVLQQFPKHRTLAPAAKTLLGVAFGQVVLGITALIIKSMADDTDVMVVATVAAHVTGGAVTLAATIALSILIRRNVQPRVEEDLEEP